MRSDFVSALFFFFFDPLFCADRNYSQGDSLFKEFFTLAKELLALRTQSGFGLSVSSVVQPVASEIVILHKPRRDSELRKLWLEDILIKAFHRPAPMVELILAVVRSEGGPSERVGLKTRERANGFAPDAWALTEQVFDYRPVADDGDGAAGGGAILFGGVDPQAVIEGSGYVVG